MHIRKRLFQFVEQFRSDVFSIYVISILGGLVSLSLPLGVQAIIGFVMGASMVTSVYVLVSLVVLGVLIVGILQIKQMRLIEQVQQRIFAKYALDVAYRIPKLDLKQLDATYLPEKIHRFFDVINIQKGFSKLLLDIPMATIQILLGIILLSLYHPLFLVLGLFLILFLVLILWFSSDKGMETSLVESKYKYAVVAWFSEMARTLKSFKFSLGSGLPLEKTDENVLGYLIARTAHFQVLLLQYRALVIFKVAISLAMLSIGSVLLIDQKLNIGEFIAAEIVILTIIGAVEKIIFSLDTVYDVLTGLEKVNSLTESAIEEGGDQIPLVSTGFAIDFHHFSFEFEADKKILRDVNLDILPGQKVCIQGDDGMGKSVLLRMLTGNYLDFKGSLLINGQPLQQLDLAAYRKRVGSYLHNQEIFHGTLWENISLGHAEIRQQDILVIAGKLGFDDFIVSFDHGFETMIDPIGKKLTSSLVKKILLLRAFVGEKSLYILEDPWVDLVASMHPAISSFIEKDLAGRTVVVVSNAQRNELAWDKVVKLENGHVHEIV